MSKINILKFQRRYNMRDNIRILMKYTHFNRAQVAMTSLDNNN